MSGSVVFGNKVVDAHALVLKPMTEPSLESPAQGWRPSREAAGSHHLVAIVPASGDHAALAVQASITINEPTACKAHRSSGWLARELEDELLTTAEQVASSCQPWQGPHTPVFLLALTAAALVIFSFMAAFLPYALAQQKLLGCLGADSSALPHCMHAAAQPISSSPSYLVDWLLGSPTFPADYLLAWGARYSPAMMHGQAYRWLSGLMLHLSSWHVGSNLALLLLLGVGLERSLGSLTLAAAWLVAALGGAFLSAALEDPCVQVCGSSGAVLGLLGMRFVKLALTWSGRDGWDKEQRPLLNCAYLVATLVAFLATTLTQPLVSHMSHLGGFLAGGAFAGLALPLQHSLQQWRAGTGFMPSRVHMQAVSALVLVALLGVVPAWVYARVLPNVECAAA